MKSRPIRVRTCQGLFPTEPRLPSVCHCDPPNGLPRLTDLSSEFFSEPSLVGFFSLNSSRIEQVPQYHFL